MLHGCKRMLEKRKKKSGFTLVEVLTSIAILSIVSVALLRAFTVSVSINRIAREMDSAKALAIDTAERYRADPYNGPGYSGYLSTYNDTEVSGKYILYYNVNFDKTKAWKTRINPGDPEEAAKGVSAYKVTITPAAVSTTTIDEYYYPAPAFNVVNTGAIEIELIKTDVSRCAINGTPPIENVWGTIKFSDAGRTAMIPIHVDCSGITSDSVIKVKNLVGTLQDPFGTDMTAVADIYLINIPKDPVAYDVEVVAEEGICTSNEVTDNTFEMIDYNATIEVERLSDNRILAQYNVSKYWIEEVSP